MSLVATSRDFEAIHRPVPPELRADEFTDFYRAVHGFPPFPWQSDLAAHVLATNVWPSLIDVPTGLGKTSMIDIVIFVAAATAGRSGQQRAGRRRCLFVVDRRVVVDEATEHATMIAEALTAAESEEPSAVLARVAQGLRALGGDPRGPVLPVAKMRGGTTWSSSWSDRPDRPGIVVGTVDQVGSRFLFRGYGVGDRRRPIDAALVGSDALLLVDEAHLAGPLLTTIQDAHRVDHHGIPLPRLDVVRLSATPGQAEHEDDDSSNDRVFRFDLAAHRDVPVAAQRLDAPKHLRLVETDAKGVHREMVAAVLAAVDFRSPAGLAPVAMAVCNTIDAARAVHGLLAMEADRSDRGFDLQLLIGRSRPVDRQNLDQDVRRRFGIGAERRSERPAVLVATQTVEVGINLDVDVLVTEAASWDALVQRLGRLNRLGRFADRFPQRGPAVAVAVYDGVEDGPVYGVARDVTWDFLRSQVETRAGEGVDVSAASCRELEPPAAAFMAGAAPPILSRPVLDQWVQTGPVPTLDPPTDPYLHGMRSETASVSVLWRKDLLCADSADLIDGVGIKDWAANALLQAVPPRAAEMVEVPLHAFRRWAMSGVAVPVSDLDGLPSEAGPPRTVREPLDILVQRASGGTGAEVWQWLPAESVRPGDVVVVPAEHGGLDQFGWAPSSTDTVVDVSEAAACSDGRLLLSLDENLPDRLGLGTEHGRQLRKVLEETWADPEAGPKPLLAVLNRVLAVDGEIQTQHSLAMRRAQLRELVAAAPTARTGPALKQLWLSPEHLRQALDSESTVDPWGLLLAWNPPAGMRDVPNGLDRNDDGELSTSVGVAGRQVTLVQHHRNVGARAADIARALGFSNELVETIRAAAEWHDMGKVEARFQIMLQGGDELEALIADEPLAKSGMDPDDHTPWLIARLRSGLPRGARHEAWSAALVTALSQQHPESLARRGVEDVDLLIHLIASHHGHARPWSALVVDDSPRPIAVDFGSVCVEVSSGDTVDLHQPARFVRLNQVYGRWGLALLEAVVRCADMTVSAEGS